MDPLTAMAAEAALHQSELAVEDELVEKSKGGESSSNNSHNVNGYSDLGPVRTRLPVMQPDKNNANLWTFLKQCIGKELTKITMPVQWNEPISLLQRISEYMNYAHLLKTASIADTSVDRLQWVATFAVSALASNFQRMGKPFNPLLGETYELRRPDFRFLCEQVGHHPPVSAWHATNNSKGQFVFRGSMYPKVKFWGKSVEFKPQGVCTVEFPQFNDVYTWSNVNCIIHNVIVGSLWMEHTGTMEIVNQVTKAKCVLAFKPGGWFSGHDDLHTVEGFLVDQHKHKVKFLYGKWTEFLCAVDIGSFEDYLNVKAEKLEANASNLPKHAPFAMGVIPNSVVLWNVDPRPEDSHKYYNFSQFAMGLNEYLPQEAHKRLCPTDCRHRPDIRALENGELDVAVQEKDRLENKQRDYRKPYKHCKKENDWWSPTWFLPCKNEYTKEEDWKYVGGYWEADFNDCPDIY